jgi:ferrochelatase
MTAAKGLLLVNLGTPDAPTTGAVRAYLREFLSDPRVLDMNPLGRWLLLEWAILRTRPAQSAGAYRKIWGEKGSPLLVHSLALAEAVAEELHGEFQVELAMRYGRPSLAEAMDRFARHGVRELTVLPLYPQEAASSASSTRARVYELAGRSWDVAGLRMVQPFFQRPGFLDAYAAVARPVLAEARPDHVLFSFHGLPEQQIRKSDPTGKHCLASADCCARLVDANRHCYRAQAFFTADGLAQRLGLPKEKWTVTFQSRLRGKWIEPYTDVVLVELAQKGVKRLAVMCPAFVADCLETLEEIGIRAKESFIAAGGEALTLVPSLNSHPAWVREVVAMARTAGI